jgi:outer membrane lipoprotein-sorting protein
MQSNHEHDLHIQSLLNSIKAQKPSDSDVDGMQTRLAAAINDYQGPVAKEPEKENESFLTWLSALFSPKALGMAGSAAALVIAVSLVMTVSVSQPAFASVIQKLTAITSMTYSGQMLSNGEAMMNIEVYYQAPSKIRVVNTPMPNITNQPSVINVMDTELGKGLIIFPQRQAAMPLDFAPGKNAKDALENKLFDWHTQIINYQGDVEINHNGEVINGIATSSFTIKPENMEIVLWVDPETELPVRIQASTMTDSQPTPFVFVADVAFNQTLDNALFDLTPDGFEILGSQSEE